MLVGIKNGVTPLENNLAGPQKANIKLHTTQKIPLLCICPAEMKIRVYAETRTQMFVALLSVRVLNRKQPIVYPPWSRDDVVYLYNGSLSHNKKEQSTHALDIVREP